MRHASTCRLVFGLVATVAAGACSSSSSSPAGGSDGGNSGGSGTSSSPASRSAGSSQSGHDAGSASGLVTGTSRSSSGSDAGIESGASCAGGGTICAGACVDTQTDNENCGGCGLTCASCQGGGCTTLLAAGPGVGWLQLFVQSGLVVWGDANGIHSVPVGGGAASTLVPPAVATGETSFTVDESGIYFPGPPDGDDEEGLPTCDVLGVPLAGGAPMTLASASASGCAVSITSDADNVYLVGLGETRFDALFRVPKSGGTPTLLYDPASPSSLGTLVVDDTNVFMVVNESGAWLIQAVPKLGGSATSLAGGYWIGGASQYTPDGIAISASAVYWLNEGSLDCGPTPCDCNNTLQSVSKNGGAVSTLATLGYEPQAPIALGGALYLPTSANCVTGSEYLVRSSLDGGALANLAVVSAGIGAIAVDETAVYWTTETVVDGGNGVSIYRRVPK